MSWVCMTLLAACMGAPDQSPRGGRLLMAMEAPAAGRPMDEPTDGRREAADDGTAAADSEDEGYPLASGGAFGGRKERVRKLLPSEVALGGTGGAAVPGYPQSSSAGGVLLLTSVYQDWALDAQFRVMTSGTHNEDARLISEVDTTAALGVRWRLLQAGPFGLWLGPRLGGLFITKRGQGKDTQSATMQGFFAEALLRFDVRFPSGFFLFGEGSARVVAPMKEDKRRVAGRWDVQPVGALGLGYAW